MITRPTTPPARLVVMASGNGSNLGAIFEACADGRLAADVVAVVSNNADAFALQRARDADVETVVAPHAGRDRAEYDNELAYTVSSFGPDLVVLAGWMRLLTTFFLSHHTTINLHPAKPGTFPGTHAIERAFEAWHEGRIDHGGVMVHYVPDEGVDNGPVIASEEVPFLPGDTLASYEARVHAVEHDLLVDAIGTVLARARV